MDYIIAELAKNRRDGRICQVCWKVKTIHILSSRGAMGDGYSNQTTENGVQPVAMMQGPETRIDTGICPNNESDKVRRKRSTE